MTSNFWATGVCFFVVLSCQQAKQTSEAASNDTSLEIRNVSSECSALTEPSSPENRAVLINVVENRYLELNRLEKVAYQLNQKLLSGQDLAIPERIKLQNDFNDAADQFIVAKENLVDFILTWLGSEGIGQEADLTYADNENLHWSLSYGARSFRNDEFVLQSDLTESSNKNWKQVMPYFRSVRKRLVNFSVQVEQAQIELGGAKVVMDAEKGALFTEQEQPKSFASHRNLLARVAEALDESSQELKLAAARLRPQSKLAGILDSCLTTELRISKSPTW